MNLRDRLQPRNATHEALRRQAATVVQPTERWRRAAVRASLGGFELLCSGTQSQRMMTCGKPKCRSATDPSARYGPFYKWARMRAGRPTQRYVSATAALRQRAACATPVPGHRQLQGGQETPEGVGREHRAPHRRRRIPSPVTDGISRSEIARLLRCNIRGMWGMWAPMRRNCHAYQPQRLSAAIAVPWRLDMLTYTGAAARVAWSGISE